MFVARPALLSTRPLRTADDARVHTLIDAGPELPLFAYWRDASETWRTIAPQWRAGAELATAFPCDDGLVLAVQTEGGVSRDDGPVDFYNKDREGQKAKLLFTSNPSLDPERATAFPMRHGSRPRVASHPGVLGGLRALGQVPFRPPSVGGWPSGAAWLTTSSVQARLKAGLTECIGCGCLSLERCRLRNPGDRAGNMGSGPRFLLGGAPKR